MAEMLGRKEDRMTEQIIKSELVRIRDEGKTWKRQDGDVLKVKSPRKVRGMGVCGWSG